MVDDQIITTSIVSLASIIAAAVGAERFTKTVRKRRDKRRSETGPDERDAIETYANDPIQFAHNILRSNEQLTKRVEAAEAKADKVEKAFEEFKREDRKFRNALARWVSRIMNAWGTEPEMPYPEGDDAKTLQDVIPSALEATQPHIRFAKPKPE